jgi:putative transposase
MRKSKFAEKQVELALRQTMAGNPSGELCLKLGITEATFYRWRRGLGGWACRSPGSRNNSGKRTGV